MSSTGFRINPVTTSGNPIITAENIITDKAEINDLTANTVALYSASAGQIIANDVKAGTGLISILTDDANPEDHWSIIPSATQNYTTASSGIINQVVQFDQALRNPRNAFDTSTYTFTAPSSGVYQINLDLRVSTAWSLGSTDTWSLLAGIFITGSLPSSQIDNAWGYIPTYTNSNPYGNYLTLRFGNNYFMQAGNELYAYLWSGSTDPAGAYDVSILGGTSHARSSLLITRMR